MIQPTPLAAPSDLPEPVRDCPFDPGGQITISGHMSEPSTHSISNCKQEASVMDLSTVAQLHSTIPQYDFGESIFLIDSCGEPIGDNVSSDIEVNEYLYYTSAQEQSNAATRCPMFVTSTVIAANSRPLKLKTLLDSGALGGNFIPLSLVKENPDLLKNLRECKGTVTLADGVTKVPIDKYLELEVQVQDTKGKVHSVTDKFQVLRSGAAHQDLIIGLPVLLSAYNDYFTTLLKENRRGIIAPRLDNVKDTPKQASAEIHRLANINWIFDADEADLNSIDQHYEASVNRGVQPLLQPAWTLKPPEEAPEDDAEHPVNFKSLLHFLGMSVEQADKEYEDMFEAHVDPEFARQTNVLQLLRTTGHKVFVPRSWTGINGIEPLELKWKAGMPARMKPHARPINPRIFEAADTEFQRLRQHVYVKSDSPIASTLVIAPKATHPFIRFCGNYVPINPYIEMGHFPIPDVQKSLAKAAKFKVFIDLDWTNAFHQIRLAEETSKKLSIVTPWGQFRPLFMPEGIGPASGILQSVVAELFEDFSDWTIAIFDNLLVLADDYKDAYEKLEMILNRCVERNVILKFSKSWLGVKEVKFFGYICTHASFKLAQDRKDALQAIPFPKNTKQMQMFLGAALFFKSFVDHFSDKTAKLNDMTRKEFNWNPETWKEPYLQLFNDLKDSLQAASELHYPDYELPWVLRTDASELGVGAVLLQLKTLEDGTIESQPIQFLSKKFSGPATKWSTIEQEAFAVYYAVHSLAYFLLGKYFILETDHRNLMWMETSIVPKIIRWLIFLQGFNFEIHHIPGKVNKVADLLSRLFRVNSTTLDGQYSYNPTILNRQCSQLQTETGPNLSVLTLPLGQTPQEIFAQVHGGRMMHHGGKRTWQDLNRYFPGHKIPYTLVEEMVANCAICQKVRLGADRPPLAPIIKTLRAEGQRSAIGIDTLQLTPDDYGNVYLVVVVNFFTKLIKSYPVKHKDAATTASCIIQYVTTYGLFDEIRSDEGSDFTSELITTLHKWLGIRHTFSLVHRPEGDGVEGSNKKILNHVHALCAEERMIKQWSRADIICLVDFVVNSVDNSETGISPLDATFGNMDSVYTQLPETLPVSDKGKVNAYVKSVADNLTALRDISKTYQNKLKAKRQAATPVEAQNFYTRGTLVLAPNHTGLKFVSYKWLGPFEVISQTGNDVLVRDLVTDAILPKLFVGELKLFVGSKEAAKHMAMLDSDQHELDKFLAYDGNPDKRSSMTFLVRFKAGNEAWLPFSKDLFDTVQYEDFCRSLPQLRSLLYQAADADKQRRAMNKLPVDRGLVGQTVYVDLRFWDEWYQALNLPEYKHLTYVVPYTYGKIDPKKPNEITVKSILLDDVFIAFNYWIRTYGSNHEPRPGWITIDNAFVLAHPEILDPTKRTKRLKEIQYELSQTLATPSNP